MADTQHFQLPIAVNLRVQSRSGRVRVIAEPREDVEAGATASMLPKRRRPRPAGPRRPWLGSLEVRCPAGTDVVVGTHSGSVRSKVASAMSPSPR